MQNSQNSALFYIIAFYKAYFLYILFNDLMITNNYKIL